MNYYEQLGIAPDSDFTAIRKAYYRRAKQCHPDLFGNAPEKAEEFKRLVMIFDTLSDPGKRRAYDETILIVRASSIGPAQWSGSSIMDSDADDTLEELIVGNEPPKDTRLTTLFLDLEKTFVFMTFREAKNLYAARKYKTAVKLFSSLVSMAPSNILYRVWLARSLTRVCEYRKAKVHYNAALILGSRRVPAQRLFTVRRELDELSRRRAPLLHPLLHRVRRFFHPPEETILKMPDEQMIEDASRIMEQLLDEDARKSRRRLGGG